MHKIAAISFTLVMLPGGKCDWKRPDTSEFVGQGQALAVNPAAHLQTDVSGRAL